jgi:phosphatidylserine/phosphatidylglycerophosphate/cardiolipin synthase-like enzyme
MPETTYIGPIRDMLAAKYPQPSPLWNLSSDNKLDDGWLWATPIDVWGKTYAQFPQAVLASGGPLGLATCTGTAGPTQLCEPMNASMTAPGQTPQKLLIGHSDEFVDAIYDVMISAEVLLDITTLSPPTGRFLDSLKNALRYLSNKPDGHRPVVRILFSNPWPNVPPVTSDPFIKDITSQLDPAKRMEIYVYVMSSSFASWNHAKIVAADGVRAIVGGHNQWGPHYLGINPVFDLSMQLTGTAARHAHNYANGLWNFGQWRKDHLYQWVNSALESIMSLQSGYLPATATGPSQVQAGVLPGTTMYATATGRFSAPPAGGTVPVLSVGRSGNSQSPYYWFPTLGSYLSPFTEPSDEALIKLVSLAQRTVRMSIQAFQVVWGDMMGWNPGLLFAMADALNRGVSIDVVASNPGALAGGLGKTEAPYDGNSPQDVNAKIIETLTGRLGLQDAAAQQIVSQRLRVANIRYSTDATYPGNVQIGNHAKSFIVDDSAFYIGSQNMYVCNLNEFGYIVEDATAAQAYLDNYWTHLWNSSKSTLTTSVDPDVKTAQQVEAMQFIMALQLDTLMNRQWSDLLDQHTSATDAAVKSAIEESMTELIVNAKFNTTSAMVLAGLQQPFFTETPPSTEPTPEALRFVANLMNDTQLMAAFDAAIIGSAGTVDAYNAAITKFLKDQGYSCTALEVLAAFKAMRDKNLAYWTGTYTTWLIDDGGVCYANSSITPFDPQAQSQAAQPHAAQPHALQARAAADTTPIPELGPVLVLTTQGATLDGTAIAKAAYNDNALTWSSSDGNPTSASLQLGTVTRATFNDSFTGAECFGSITYPSTGADRSGVYSLYARVSGPAPDQPTTPTDGKSHTLEWVLGTLAVAATVALLGLYRWVSARRQADLVRAAREEQDSGRGTDPNEVVTSDGRVVESLVIGESTARYRVNAARESIERMVPFESGMTLTQRGRLASAAQQVRTTDEALRNPTAEALPDVVPTAATRLDGVISSIKDILSAVGSKLSAQSRTQIEESNRVADDLGKAFDDIVEQREEDKPFEFEEDIFS